MAKRTLSQTAFTQDGQIRFYRGSYAQYWEEGKQPHVITADDIAPGGAYASGDNAAKQDGGWSVGQVDYSTSKIKAKYNNALYFIQPDDNDVHNHEIYLNGELYGTAAAALASISKSLNDLVYSPVTSTESSDATVNAGRTKRVYDLQQDVNWTSEPTGSNQGIVHFLSEDSIELVSDWEGNIGKDASRGAGYHVTYKLKLANQTGFPQGSIGVARTNGNNDYILGDDIDGTHVDAKDYDTQLLFQDKFGLHTSIGIKKSGDNIQLISKASGVEKVVSEMDAGDFLKDSFLESEGTGFYIVVTSEDGAGALKNDIMLYGPGGKYGITPVDSKDIVEVSTSEGYKYPTLLSKGDNSDQIIDTGDDLVNDVRPVTAGLYLRMAFKSTEIHKDSPVAGDQYTRTTYKYMDARNFINDYRSTDAIVITEELDSEGTNVGQKQIQLRIAPSDSAKPAAPSKGGEEMVPHANDYLIVREEDGLDITNDLKKFLNYKDEDSEINKLIQDIRTLSSLNKEKNDDNGKAGIYGNHKNTAGSYSEYDFKGTLDDYLAKLKAEITGVQFIPTGNKDNDNELSHWDVVPPAVEGGLYTGKDAGKDAGDWGLPNNSVSAPSKNVTVADWTGAVTLKSLRNLLAKTVDDLDYADSYSTGSAQIGSAQKDGLFKSVGALTDTGITTGDVVIRTIQLNGKISVYHDTLTSRTLTHNDIIGINIAGTTGGEALNYTHQTILKNGNNTQTLGNALLQMAIDLTWHDVASEGGGTIAVNTES
jgi:hypothetical protein